MKTFKQFSNNPVSMLKAAIVKKKSIITTASDKESYDIIDKIMTDIAKTYDISGEELHDMWVKKYDVTPDEWIKKKLNSL
jgi:hypothetical protein